MVVGKNNALHSTSHVTFLKFINLFLGYNSVFNCQNEFKFGMASQDVPKFRVN